MFSSNTLKIFYHNIYIYKTLLAGGFAKVRLSASSSKLSSFSLIIRLLRYPKILYSKVHWKILVIFLHEILTLYEELLPLTRTILSSSSQEVSRVEVRTIIGGVGTGRSESSVLLAVSNLKVPQAVPKAPNMEILKLVKSAAKNVKT